MDRRRSKAINNLSLAQKELARISTSIADMVDDMAREDDESKRYLKGAMILQEYGKMAKGFRDLLHNTSELVRSVSRKDKR